MTKICKDGRPWGRNNSYNDLDYKKKLSDAKKGENNPFWKGCQKKKYQMKVVNGERIYVHRFMMERYLCRKLKSNEIVHHKNGDVSDNREENLELTDRKSHAKQHSDNRRLGL